MGINIDMIAEETMDISEKFKVLRIDREWALYIDGNLSDFKYSKPYNISAGLMEVPYRGKIEVYTLTGEMLFECAENGEHLRNLILTSFKPCEIRKYAETKRLARDYENPSRSTISCVEQRNRIIITMRTGYNAQYTLISNKDKTDWENIVDAKLQYIQKIAGAQLLVAKEQTGLTESQFIADDDFNILAGPIYGSMMALKSDPSKFMFVTNTAKARSYGMDIEDNTSKLKDGTLMESGIYQIQKTGKELSLNKLIAYKDGTMHELSNGRICICVEHGENSRSIICNSNGIDQLGFEITVISEGADKADIVGINVSTKELIVYSCVTSKYDVLDQFDSIERGFNNVLYIKKGNEVVYYKHGVFSNNLTFNYVAARPLDTPMCKVKMFAGQLPNGVWVVTDAIGEPVEAQTYNYIEDLQEVYKRKICVPTGRKFKPRKIYPDTKNK